ncbi:MAG TPA: sigma-70 family RNA polymerase sigma factor [Terriglobia bacterium]|jgi:RNA polymerase sigma-70 factor (ECF subfamily)
MSTGADGEETNGRRGGRKTEELFVEHYRFMYTTAYKFLKEKADAEDVVQNLFFKFLGRELPPDVWADPKGYFYRSVRNACFNWKDSRKSRKEKPGVEELEIVAPRSGRAHENAVHELDHLMGTLDDDIARIVMLHADDGLSDAEIAEMLGQSRSKIASILSRARQKLKKVTGARRASKEKHAGT